MKKTAFVLFAASLLLAGCAQLAPRQPLACDDSLKQAFHPDADTTVVAVRPIAKGTQLVAVDSPSPITAANDMCLVKLLVGPGATQEKDRSAKSWTEGIGMEVWLPAPAAWNERIRNYGGGGWVGGGHRYPDQIGSKVPALVMANMGYASGTHDGGQPHYQDPSFAFLSDGRINAEAMRDMSRRAMYEQAVKTRALVEAYYGRAPRYAYYDGHSTGGRQGLKVAQEWPELYDGYLVGQPAVNAPKFGLAALYPQVVMKQDLGISAADKPAAEAFARKVGAATARAVAACDREHLGFLLDPSSCGYDPLRDAGALCTGAAGQGVTGSNTDAAACLSVKEATALDKIWYGPSTDGSWDPAQSANGRAGRVLGVRQLWWGFPRGSNLAGGITNARTDILAIALQDVSWAADASVNNDAAFTNTSTPVRNRWRELDYASYAKVLQGVDAGPILREHMSDKADLSAFRSQGRKMVWWNGLAEDAIPPAGAAWYYGRVQAWAGGAQQVQSFLRMYNIPGLAHSSQGRAYTVSGNNNSVPIPWLPGNGNQTPDAAHDQMFSALVDWVEHGIAPGAIIIGSRDGSTSYPICVYPQQAAWDGDGNPHQAASYSCK
jgi:feruloyl esterase